jgi:hypothetical protein
MQLNESVNNSLHEISISMALQASIGRNLKKIAIYHKTGQLTYEDIRNLLMESSTNWKVDPRCFEILNLFKSVASKSNSLEVHDENTILKELPHNISERALAMSILNITVFHPILSRDSISAVPFSFIDPMGVVALIAPLFLGGSLRLIDPDCENSILSSVSNGEVNQAWLGPYVCRKFLKIRLPKPHAMFRGFIYVGIPKPTIYKILTEWVGVDKVHIIANDKY